MMSKKRLHDKRRTTPSSSQNLSHTCFSPSKLTLKEIVELTANAGQLSQNQGGLV